jgi:hypothetical protein
VQVTWDRDAQIAILGSSWSPTAADRLIRCFHLAAVTDAGVLAERRDGDGSRILFDAAAWPDSPAARLAEAKRRIAALVCTAVEAYNTRPVHAAE